MRNFSKVKGGRHSVGTGSSGRSKVAKGNSHQTFKTIVIYLEI
jgi:hypothetical protein